jgi:hypothetical protein
MAAPSPNYPFALGDLTGGFADEPVVRRRRELGTACQKQSVAMGGQADGVSCHVRGVSAKDKAFRIAQVLCNALQPKVFGATRR